MNRLLDRLCYGIVMHLPVERFPWWIERRILPRAGNHAYRDHKQP